MSKLTDSNSMQLPDYERLPVETTVVSVESVDTYQVA